jgi:hypothetical protein
MEKDRIVGYCRVSTLEQKKRGYGTDIQMREIKNYAEVFRLAIDEFYLNNQHPELIIRIWTNPSNFKDFFIVSILYSIRSF